MKLLPTLPYEPRPRDFAARLRRARVPTLGERRARRHRGRRLLLILAAAVAVPALASPAPWKALGIGNAGDTGFTVDPMPFEQVGASFPGSAYYYIAPTPLPGADATSSDGIDLVGIGLANGPIARAMRIDNSGVDRSRAVECLTAAVYYEAASEPDQGQRAVAQVVLNRVAHPAFPNTVCGVVYQGSERSTGCQFSFTCDGSLARVPSRFFWQRARNVAEQALSGYVESSVGLATHYHTNAVHPYWAPSLHFITSIGAHRFYGMMGRAGDAATFRFAYAGGEPLAAPHPRDAKADKLPDPVLDPLALQRAYDGGFKTAQGPVPAGPGGEGQGAPAAPGPAPRYSAEVQNRGGDKQYSGEALPGSHGVKPEYEGSGQWIKQPGG
ncbi:MAG: cell wall hydrolase [Novosphingobium sp.]